MVTMAMMGCFMLQCVTEQGLVISNRISNVDSRIQNSKKTRCIDFFGRINIKVILPDIQTRSGSQDLMLETQIGK